MSRLAVHDEIYQIDITPADVATFVNIRSESITMDFAYEQQTGFYNDDDGKNFSDTTGITITFSASGSRDFGNTAHDFLAGLVGEIGEAAKTTIEVTTNGVVYTVPVTIMVTVLTGGGSTDNVQLEWDATSDGEWTKV